MTPRQKLIKEVRLMLGEGMVRVGLTPDHYDLALDLALDRYRMRSSNSVSERYTFLELQPDQTIYTLPEEITEVRQILRRGTTGTAGGSGANFDPFASAFTAQMGAGLSSGGSDLVTYELAAEYQELIGRMFGASINFTWESGTHRLEIMRQVRGAETVLLWVYTMRSETVLLANNNARTWLRDYTSARCKVFLGEARGKFGNIVGPQGGTTLNGDALKSEGQAEMERLENEVANQMDQDIGYGFTIG